MSGFSLLNLDARSLKYDIYNKALDFPELLDSILYGIGNI